MKHVLSLILVSLFAISCASNSKEEAVQSDIPTETHEMSHDPTPEPMYLNEEPATPVAEKKKAVKKQMKGDKNKNKNKKKAKKSATKRG